MKSVKSAGENDQESQSLESNQFHSLLGPIASPLHSQKCFADVSKSHSLN